MSVTFRETIMLHSLTCPSYVELAHPQINDEAYRRDILRQIIGRLNWMIGHHNKVLLIRFDVRFPDGYPHDGNNREISSLLRRLRENIEWSGVEVQYCWVREQVSSLTPHYHIVMMVDGSKIQNPMGILREADRIWNHSIGYGGTGLVNFCCHDGGVGHVMLRRPSSVAEGEALETAQREFRDAYDDATRRIMYLAKTYSKGGAPPRAREYGCSQID